MRLAALVAVLGAAGAAAAVIAFVFTSDSDAPATAVRASSPAAAPVAAAPTPLPQTWLASLAGVDSSAQPELISCRDSNGDLQLDARDGMPGIDITLIAGEACAHDGVRADYYADPAERIASSCDVSDRTLLVAGVASAGSDLLAPREGESLGLIEIINGVRQRADREHGVPSWLVLSAAAVFGAEQPQTSMERWLAREVALRLDAAPCLRAVLIGHSHGGATVTSVTAALDAAYAGRMLGVLIDRTTALYDRPASELPSQTPILNFYQLSEGWHGVPIDAPNVTNIDESAERAPIAPSDGGGAPALVSHKTLDDAPNTQQRVVEAILEWATR